MNEFIAHEQYVCSHLDDRTAARALVDHYEELRGVTHRVALRAVAALRKHTRDAAEVAEATALLAKGSAMKRPIERIIRSAGSEQWRMLATILVVPGSRYPEPSDDRRQAMHRTWWSEVIRIGARRVLMIAAAIRDEWEDARAEGQSWAEFVESY